MYPTNPAALLSYLVLCLIECDMLGRQKSWLIQSNKLPWAKRQMQSKGAADPHNITLSLLTFSIYGFFFHSISKRSTDLKSQDPEYLMFSPSLYKLFWSSCHECLTGGNERQKVLYCFVLSFASRWAEKILLLLQVHAVCQAVTLRLVALCMRTWICVHQIPEHFDSCMHSVVIIKPKSHFPRPLLKCSE